MQLIARCPSGKEIDAGASNSIPTVNLLFPVHWLLFYGKDVLWKSLKRKFLKLIQNRQFTLKRITEARSCNHCYRATALSITYSESVFVPLGIQHALWSVWLYNIFPRYFINGTFFWGLGGGEFLNMKYAFWFSVRLLSQTLRILQRICRDAIINVRKYSCKVPFFLSDFN